MICDWEAYQCTVSLGVPVLIILLASIGSMIVLQGAIMEWVEWWKGRGRSEGPPRKDR